MQLVIEKDTMIKDIQKQFNSLYPYLKIEFFNQPSTEKKTNTKADKLNAEVSIGKQGKWKQPGAINIDGTKTVAELAKDILKVSGLTAQIYRKSGNLWIETTLTDNWSLEKQNKEGESFNGPVKSWSKTQEDDSFDQD